MTGAKKKEVDGSLIPDLRGRGKPGREKVQKMEERVASRETAC